MQTVPYRINPRRNIPRHILIKLTKTKHKERILKATREKQQVTYKGHPICLTAGLSAETLQGRREWQDIIKVVKGKNLQPILLYPARASFKNDGEIKSFSDKQKLREFSTTKQASVYSVGDPGLIPGSGRCSGEGNGTPLQSSCLENPMDGGAW